MPSGDWDEHADTDGSRSLTSVVDQTVPTLIIFTGVGLLLLDYSMFWIVFVIGFSGLFPAARSFAQWYDSTHEAGPSATSTPSDDQALETLRNRYAKGEIDEVEFERQVENLLETESAADAKASATSSDIGRERTKRESKN